MDQITRVACIGACLAFTSCSNISEALSSVNEATGNQPVVKGIRGGVAAMTLITCPTTLGGQLGVQRMIEFLISYNQSIVFARDGGSARLTIDQCGVISNNLKTRQ